jgi:hypothetical protein
MKAMMVPPFVHQSLLFFETPELGKIIGRIHRKSPSETLYKFAGDALLVGFPNLLYMGVKPGSPLSGPLYDFCFGNGFVLPVVPDIPKNKIQIGKQVCADGVCRGIRRAV